MKTPYCRYPDIFYVPESADFLVREGVVRWPHNGGAHSLMLRAGKVYIPPCGTRIQLEKIWTPSNKF